MMKPIDFLSERMVFGFMLITGYFATVWFVGFFPMPDNARQVMRDALLTVGPILGIIANAIWKTDKTDKDNASTIRTLSEKVSSQQSDGGYATVTVSAPLADGGTAEPAPDQPAAAPRFKAPGA